MEKEQKDLEQKQPEQPLPVVVATADSDEPENMEHVMELSDKIFHLIVSSIQKKPQTASEALALVAYIYEKDISPLLSKLRSWAISELKTEIVKMKAGWCVPRK